MGAMFPTTQPMPWQTPLQAPAYPTSVTPPAYGAPSYGVAPSTIGAPSYAPAPSTVPSSVPSPLSAPLLPPAYFLPQTAPPVSPLPATPFYPTTPSLGGLAPMAQSFPVQPTPPIPMNPIPNPQSMAYTPPFGSGIPAYNTQYPVAPQFATQGAPSPSLSPSPSGLGDIPPPEVLAPYVFHRAPMQSAPGVGAPAAGNNNNQQNNYYNNFYGGSPFGAPGAFPGGYGYGYQPPPTPPALSWPNPSTSALPTDQKTPEGQQNIPPVPPPGTSPLDPNKPAEPPKPGEDKPTDPKKADDAKPKDPFKSEGVLDGPTIERLNRRLENPSATIRSEAAMDLFKILEASPHLSEDPEVGPWVDALIQKILKDPSPLVRQPALLALELGYVKQPTEDVRGLLRGISKGSALYDLEAPIADNILNLLSPAQNPEGPVAAAQHNTPVMVGPDGRPIPPEMLQGQMPPEAPPEKKSFWQKIWPFGKKKKQAAAPEQGMDPAMMAAMGNGPLGPNGMPLPAGANLGAPGVGSDILGGQVPNQLMGNAPDPNMIPNMPGGVPGPSAGAQQQPSDAEMAAMLAQMMGGQQPGQGPSQAGASGGKQPSDAEMAAMLAQMMGGQPPGQSQGGPQGPKPSGGPAGKQPSDAEMAAMLGQLFQAPPPGSKPGGQTSSPAGGQQQPSDAEMAAMLNSLMGGAAGGAPAGGPGNGMPAMSPQEAAQMNEFMKQLGLAGGGAPQGAGGLGGGAPMSRPPSFQNAPMPQGPQQGQRINYLSK